MQMNRSVLVALIAGSVASVALAGPKEPRLSKPMRKQLSLATADPIKKVPLEYVKIRKMPDGRIIQVGPVKPYVAPANVTDDPTLDAFNLAGTDVTTGDPIGGECAGAGAVASSRWWFGATAVANPHYINDFQVDAAATGKPIDRVDILWNWGVSGLRPMWIGLFIADTFHDCATGIPPSAGPLDGVAYHFADDAGGANGYYNTSIGLPPDPAEGLIAPADGKGAYEVVFGAFDTTAQTWTLDLIAGTQPMLWGIFQPFQKGVHAFDNQWDDDTPSDGLFVASECYNYNYGPNALPGGGCPNNPSLLAGTISFWASPGNACYANCDGSTGAVLLTANDFQCFINAFAAGAAYANCDGSTGQVLLTANDFQCFINSYASGCS